MSDFLLMVLLAPLIYWRSCQIAALERRYAEEECA